MGLCDKAIVLYNTTGGVGELKIENFQWGIGIAEKTYKTRRDHRGGNVNHKSLF